MKLQNVARIIVTVFAVCAFALGTITIAGCTSLSGETPAENGHQTKNKVDKMKLLDVSYICSLEPSEIATILDDACYSFLSVNSLYSGQDLSKVFTDRETSDISSVDVMLLQENGNSFFPIKLVQEIESIEEEGVIGVIPSSDNDSNIYLDDYLVKICFYGNNYLRVLSALDSDAKIQLSKENPIWFTEERLDHLDLQNNKEITLTEYSFRSKEDFTPGRDVDPNQQTAEEILKKIKELSGLDGFLCGGVWECDRLGIDVIDSFTAIELGCIEINNKEFFYRIVGSSENNTILGPEYGTIAIEPLEDAYIRTGTNGLNQLIDFQLNSSVPESRGYKQIR